MIKQIFEKLLGIYRIGEWSNNDFIAASKPIEDKYRHSIQSFVTAPHGLTRYTKNNPEIIICRTRLGLFFPSLRYVTLEDTPVLRPDQLRKVSGYFIVFFLFMVLIVLTVMIFEPLEKRAPNILVSSLLFGGFLAATIWIGTKLEYFFLTWGIRKIIVKEQKNATNYN